jgi:hypothetical protein
VVDRRAALASGALLLAGCGTRSLRSRVKKGAKVTPSDVGILNRLLEVEYYGIAAYTAGIPFLPHREKQAAKQFLGQDVTHASTLAGLIKEGHGKAVSPQPSYDLGRPSGPDILALLHRLEGEQLDAYIQLIPSLSPGRLRATAAAIMANDAQHLAALRAAAGRAPVPSALASGRE